MDSKRKDQRDRRSRSKSPRRSSHSRSRDRDREKSSDEVNIRSTHKRRRQERDEEKPLNEPLRTHFKPDPDAVLPTEPLKTRIKPDPDSAPPTEPLKTRIKPDPDTVPVPTPDPKNQPSPSSSPSRNKKPNDDSNEPVAGPSKKAKEEPIPLSNIFEFPSKPLPKIEPMPPTTMGAPLPKLPLQAHYNMHNEEEQRSYVKSNVKKDAPIPGHQVI